MCRATHRYRASIISALGDDQPAKNEKYTRELLHLEAKIRASWRATLAHNLPFIVWPEYHIHCQSIPTSNYAANNRLCHKTAQGEIPIDLPDFVWVQLREQPGRP